MRLERFWVDTKAFCVHFACLVRCTLELILLCFELIFDHLWICFAYQGCLRSCWMVFPGSGGRIQGVMSSG